MKILNVPIDLEIMKSNMDDISDSARSLVYEKDSELFNTLNYDEDSIFLEPTLFSYFIDLELEKDSTLDQILWNHIDIKNRRKKIKVRSDGQGYIYMPNHGYLKVQYFNTFFSLEFFNEEITLKYNDEKVNFEFEEFKYLENTKIKVCYHEPAMLTSYLGEEFRNSIKKSFDDYYQKLNSSFNLLKIISPNIYELIKMTHKEMYIFNGRKRESLAALSFFGGVLLNTDGQNQTEVFFLDDLSHQCGHIIFYALTLQAKDFLKPEPRELINKFTFVEWELREVYGVFHGLFTYTCILDTLDKCIEKKIIKEKGLLEVYARIGFYMNKFIKDLSKMNNNQIFTEKGFKYYDYFKSGYDKIENKYKHVYRNMNYEHKMYMFNFEAFLKHNDVELLNKLILQ